MTDSTAKEQAISSTSVITTATTGDLLLGNRHLSSAAPSAPSSTSSAPSSPGNKGVVNNNNDISRLFQMCNDDKNEESWQLLLEWMEDMRAFKSKLKRLVTYKDPKNAKRTFLHLASVHQAPIAVVEALLELAEQNYTSIRIVEDANGATPLHLACQYGVSAKHIRLLATNFTLTMVDRMGRTPLHVAMEHASNDKAAETIHFLLERNPTQQKRILNRQHKSALACLANVRLQHLQRNVTNAFDAYVGTVQVTTETSSQSYTKQLLLTSTSQSKTTNTTPTTTNTNTTNSTLSEQQQQQADRDFFPILGELPAFVQDHAAWNPTVQTLVNQRFCSSDVTFLYVLRLVSLLVIIVSFHIYWKHGNEYFPQNQIPLLQQQWFVAFVFLAASTSVLCATDLGILAVRIYKAAAFRQWQQHPLEISNLMVMLAVLVFAILAQGYEIQDPETFQVLSIVAAFLLALAWAGVLSCVRLVSKDFSTLVDGVLATGRKLFAFAAALTIVLVAFAQLFYLTTLELVVTTSTMTTFDSDTNRTTTTTDTQRDVTCPSESPFCTSFGQALLTIYTMAVGEVDMADVPENNNNHVFVTILYVCFIYIVILLLANILAFIIGNDIWRNERTEQFFWANRIRFLADIEALTRVCCCCRTCTTDDILGKSWQALWSIFDDHRLGALSPSFWFMMILRVNVMVVMIVWIVVGVLTLGYVWPPQVRQALFWAPITTTTTATTTTAGVPTAEMGKIWTPATHSGDFAAASDVHAVQKNVQRLEAKMDHLEHKLDRVLSMLERDVFHDESSVFMVRGGSDHAPHHHHPPYPRRGSMGGYSLASIEEPGGSPYPRRGSIGASIGYSMS
ncbi:Ankyrin Repeat [Seminavis robusta]|uniref:Ankyrin Repeat n=1 Tax=Seminavis robusta TaxID=568900 RepID=A0A9N8HNH8_9STRA|nr:Ankyrin Repeat [Seminavis robusta]|eukprot:Sro1085_g239610.1 Ankyrin Repeat (848) ;mRNA; f:18203-20746